MRGTVVAIVRGGPSSEHEVSLKSGHAMLSNLSRDHYTVRDIYIDRQGVWHERGLATTPARVLPGVDVVLNALHGEYGEDGEIQKVFEKYGVPYTGSDSFASFVAMHKVMAKEKAKEAGLKTPKYKFIERLEDADEVVHEIIRTFSQPVIIKPARGGSSVGVTMEAGYQPVHQAVTGLLAKDIGGVLVEEVIRGTEATAGVVEGLRNESLYALPPIEIIPPDHAPFFTYDVKYSGETREIVPGRFPKHIMDELIQSARTMHDVLGLRHYSRSDFIVSPRGIYYLETNTLPGLTAESLLPKSLKAVGVEYPDFLTHLIGLALGRGKR
ncbi:MAG: D-alanine--D-alanine ligase [Parcubacteria group bacterium]|nr:D-alanine--D-alanine ligase [Parcubacteria group bacterium]